MRWGGKQPFLRDSVITHEECLGRGNRILEVGSIQKFQFDENSNSPFYDKMAPKYNREFNHDEKEENRETVQIYLIVESFSQKDCF